MVKHDAGILKLSITLDRKYECDLNTDLDIDKGAIDKALSDQPSMFAWYAVLSEMAKAAALSAKNDLELTEAELDQQIRREWDTDKYGKMTEAGIQSIMRMLTKHKRAVEAYHTAKKNEGIMAVAKQSFEQRKDMLISIASNMRAEMDVNLRINKQSVAEKIRKIKES